MSDTSLADLRCQWRELYSQELPRLAKARHHAQPKWPVALDHCFARIILDNTVGKAEQQWDKVIKKPAVQNMDERQLRAAIELGEDIKAGKVDLQELDEKSLRCRGKDEGKYGKVSRDDTSSRSLKRKRDEENETTTIKEQTRMENDQADAVDEAQKVPLESATNHDSTRKEGEARGGSPKHVKLEKRQSTLSFSADSKMSSRAREVSSIPSSEAELSFTKKSPERANLNVQAILNRIESQPGLTPYRRRLYTTLLSVPRGRYTTYAALSKYLTSSPRAVGSGMRNNPFAPDVPCHRVLAADGSIGGFGGSWGKDGENAGKKVKLLREEGVRFLGDGKVVGEPFRAFHDFDEDG